MSLVKASAEVVLPIPGVPMSMTALLDGVPLFQESAQAFSSPTALGLPITSVSDFGLYFSVQS